MSTPATRPQRLRDNPLYRSLWLAASVSDLGTEISTIAIPLVAIITLRATNLEVGLVATAQTIPLVALSLPVGVLVDRFRKGTILVWADLARAALLLTIPVTYWLGGLTIWQLYAVVFLVGSFTITFDIARMSVLPEIVPGEQLASANGYLDASEQGSAVAGPGVGGVLIGQAGAPAAVLLDAVSYLWSAGFLARMPSDRPQPAREPVDTKAVAGVIHDIGEGLRYVMHQPYLRPLAIAGSVLVLASRTAQVVLLLYLVRGVGLSATLVGIVFSVGSIGFLGGALLGPRLSRRLGPGPALLTASAVIGLALLVMAGPTPATATPFIVAALMLYGLAALTFNITNLTLRQTVTPPQLLGRANATARFLSSISAPVAGVAGGTLATILGYRQTLGLAGVFALAGSAVLVASPVRTLDKLPQP